MNLDFYFPFHKRTNIRCKRYNYLNEPMAALDLQPRTRKLTARINVAPTDIHAHVIYKRGVAIETR